MSKNTAVFGIYATRIHAEEGVDALRQAGFRNTDISALFPDNQGSKDFAHEKNTKAPEGTTTGAASGVVVGGVLGWLAGIGLLAIPGIGPLLAAGPIVAALAGAGAVGVVGGVVGALVGLGIPEYEAKRYEGRIKSGSILLSVHCESSDWVARAEKILKNTGAEDIASTEEARGHFTNQEKQSAAAVPVEQNVRETVADERLHANRVREDVVHDSVVHQDLNDTAEIDTAQEARIRERTSRITDV